jgi:single-strand DNA-binding protein
MYLNKAIIVGNLTRDPELKVLPSGIKVSSFSLATNRVWKDKDGKKNEAADFHNIVVFGNQAESVSTYMKKGNSLLVEGRLQTRSWEKDGVKMYSTEIVAENIQFGNKTKNTDNQEKVEETEAVARTVNGMDYPAENINSDDIPF